MPPEDTVRALGRPDEAFRGRFSESAEGFRTKRPRDDAGLADLVQRVRDLVGIDESAGDATR
jgi:hypothetical protein